MNVQPDRQEWLAARRRGIGGSDIAAVLGLSPYKTPFDLWLDKRGEGEEVDPDTPALYWGTVLEEVVAKEYARRSGVKIQRVNGLLQHPALPIAFANIDRAVVNPAVAGTVRWKDDRLTTDRILECKTANGFAARAWGEAETDDVPAHYLLQVQWYLGITGCAVGDLAVLIGGQDFRTYTIQRDDSLIADLLDEARKFWTLVESGVAPDPQTVEDAKRKWPQHITGRSIIVDVDVSRACEKLADIKARTKALEAEEKAVQLEIFKAFGEAEEITYGGERLATWKAQSTDRIDAKALRAAHPDVAALFTTTTTTRVLRLAKTKE